MVVLKISLPSETNSHPLLRFSSGRMLEEIHFVPFGPVIPGEQAKGVDYMLLIGRLHRNALSSSIICLLSVFRRTFASSLCGCDLNGRLCIFFINPGGDNMKILGAGFCISVRRGRYCIE